MTTHPTAAVKPSVPPEAAEAALIAFERGIGYSHRERVRWALAAALPHLLPGWFIAEGSDGDPCIWMPGTPAHPDRPELVMARTALDSLAALLPDRTEEEDPS